LRSTLCVPALRDKVDGVSAPEALPTSESSISATEAPVRVLSVELSADGIAEWGDRRHVVFVPRDAIVGVELRRGIGGERPIVQVLFAVALIAGGLVLTGALSVAGQMPRGAGRLAAGGVLLLVLGGYVLWTAVRPKLFLLVRTRNDQRKLLFHGRVDLASLRAALDEAKLRFGYDVTWAVQIPEKATRPYRS
jgi:hypothetical protein